MIRGEQLTAIEACHFGCLRLERITGDEGCASPSSPAGTSPHGGEAAMVIVLSSASAVADPFILSSSLFPLQFGVEIARSSTDERTTPKLGTSSPPWGEGRVRGLGRTSMRLPGEARSK